MCGICGFTGEDIPGLLGRMNEAIRHRGPDSDGFFSRGQVHLANRRLRVVDLEGGDQPIFNEDGSIVVVFNGEIYNHRELRQRLEASGHRFKTSCDTEVLVHLYEEFGDTFASHLNGMFAFALYDLRRQRLLLVRDQVGIKPLLYTTVGDHLLFGSEAKSLLEHPQMAARLDPEGLHLLLNIRFVPAPRTLFEGVSQLPPGHGLVFENSTAREFSYHQWDFPGTRDLSPDDAAEAFRHTLKSAVERQLEADVPVGIFLSGGIDSSSVLWAAHAARGEDLNTFSLGFGEPTDELDDAALVARHFGSAHRAHTLSLRPLELYPRIVYHAEQPKVNAPQGYYLSRLARKEVTVALSGLGGDELFLGYDLYRYLWPGRLLIDSPMARLLALGRPLANGLARGLRRWGGPPSEVPRRALELAASAADPSRYYLTLRNGWDLLPGAAQGIYTEAWQRRIATSTRQAFAPYFDRPELSFLEQVQWAEFRAKMVDDFLLNEDRMSMANSLEVRVPLLDLEMVQFAFDLPRRVKWQDGELKPVMKRALAGALPAHTLRKKKWGFTANPYEQFRKDLRTLAARELNTDFLAEQGIFNPDFVRQILDHRPSPKLRWHYFMLWQILGLKFWQEIFLEGRSYQEIEERIRS